MIHAVTSISICHDCGNLFNSHGTRNRISDFYSNSYDLFGASFEAETTIFRTNNSFSISDWRLEHLSSLSILPKIGSILDIGCGKGNFLQKFGTLFSQWTLYGIESSKASLVIAKNNLDNSIFYEGIYSSQLFDKKFELIVAFNVLEHVENPRLFLQNIFDDLKKDGIVCFDVPNFKVNPADVFIYDHLTHFTKETLENLLHNIGFEILKVIERKDQVSMMVICKKRTFVTELENFYSLTNNLLTDSLHFNQELFSMYNSINNSSENFGVVGLGAFIWKGIQMNAIDISKIFSFYDENLTLINSKVNGIPINSLNKIPQNSLPLIFSVSPCYIDKLKEKLFQYKNNLFIPKSYLYYQKYFN